jgi:hypothetical protein
MAANWTTFVAGNVLEASQLNGVVDNFADIAIFNETQASGTAGGTFTSGSYVKRTLNTTVVNNITGCSIASSVITLPAGTYSVFATSPAFEVNNNKCRLRNTTAGTDLAIGNSSYAASTATVNVLGTIQTCFTLAGSTDIELQHRCASTKATNGFGAQTSFGDSEIYSQITIVRVA